MLYKENPSAAYTSSLSKYRPELFKGKKVLVVGLCNSGVDAVASLQGHADKVYLAYRHGAHIVCRSKPSWYERKVSPVLTRQHRFPERSTAFPLTTA